MAEVQWVVIGAENEHSSSQETCVKSSSSSSSSSSSDMVEDASSSCSSSSSSSYGPLYQLSDLMAQLPIKRGLSEYYQGKSQSFKSLASVASLEDLAKKGNSFVSLSYNKRMKKSVSSNSNGGGGGGDGNIRYGGGPKATIAKKRSDKTKLSAAAWLLN